MSHNLLSKNQLAEWNHFETSTDSSNANLEKINDYYDCLIECETDHTDKRICNLIL